MTPIVCWLCISLGGCFPFSQHFGSYSLSCSPVLSSIRDLSNKHLNKPRQVVNWNILSPSRIWYDCGKGTPKTQWAAVTTYWGVTSVPPHLKSNSPDVSFLIWSSACHGHECGMAASPPTIRDMWRAPQGRFSKEGESVWKRNVWIEAICYEIKAL